MSKTKIIIHAVFSTKQRENTINPDYKKELYAFLYDILKKNNCWVYRINGMNNHVHILFDLNPTVALAELMKTIKWNSSKWLRGNSKFPVFKGWNEGYFAGSISPEIVDRVKEYIINQERHHVTGDFLDEVQNLINLYSLSWHPDDW